MSDQFISHEQAVSDGITAAILPLQSLIMLLIKHNAIPKEQLAEEFKRLIGYAQTMPNAPVLEQTWQNMLAAIEGRELPYSGD